jgi:photosystem II stability/assembly factor-like uncharacterized protein
VWTTGELYGGNIEEVIVNPITPTTVYAHSIDVGLFRSRNGGESWTLVYAPGVHHLAMDPFTTTTIYWESAEGLYRSDDEGDTWTPLGVWGAPYPHPTISGTVYVGGGDLWMSEDRGQTWVTMTNGLTDTGVAALAIHPTDSMTMALATENGHVFRSTDGGESWTYASTPVDYPSSLAFNPWMDNKLWISAGCFSGDNSTFKNTTVSYTEWVSMALPPVNDIDFAPPGWGSVLSQTVFAADCFASAYRTTDGGDTWDTFGPQGAGGNSIALHPTDPNTIYSASWWDGVFKTTNGGDTWRVVQEGLTAVVPRQLTPVPGQPDVVYALTQRPEAIYKTEDGGHIWRILPITQTYGRRVEAIAVDPITPTRTYAGASRDPGLRIHISDDGGETWPRFVPITPTEQYSDCDGLFLDVLLAHPKQRGLLLAGVNHNYQGGGFFYNLGTIYRSTDHGEHWTHMTITQEISTVTDLAFDTLTPTFAYAATAGQTGGSGLYRSTDGGQMWSRIGADEPALDCVEHLAVEQDSDHRVFAQTCTDGLYVSADHGESWTQIASWLMAEQILCTDEDPSVLYVARTSGLIRSVDGAQSWSRAAGALGYVPIYSLATVTATNRVILYAGTIGGYMQSDGAQALSLASNNGTLVNAGVYRYTTRRAWGLYLPLVLKAYTP